MVKKKTAISVMPATAFGRKNENYIITTFHKLMMTNAIYTLTIPVSKWGLECKYILHLVA